MKMGILRILLYVVPILGLLAGCQKMTPPENDNINLDHASIEMGDTPADLDDRLAAGTETEVVEPYISYALSPFTVPPALKLEWDGNSDPINLGTHSWYYATGNGLWSGINADHAHPLDCEEFVDPIILTDTYTKLTFESEPDVLEVRCWPDSAWGKTNTKAKTIALNGFELPLNSGGYVYEVTARWNDNGGLYHGSAYYYFYAVVE